ncbi:hypothetical protein [Paenibacillus ferrarius]
MIRCVSAATRYKSKWMPYAAGCHGKMLSAGPDQSFSLSKEL